MVRLTKQEGRYRKSSFARTTLSHSQNGHSSGESLRDLWKTVTAAETKLVDERKTYASKVRSLIEKKHRSLRQVRKTGALRQILTAYPKDVNKRNKVNDHSDVYNIDNNDNDDNSVEDIYESQKLNFRRMVSSTMYNKQTCEDDSDFNSWSDLESNFSLTYEPLTSGFVNQNQWSSNDDDILLTLEKVKNCKNKSNNGNRLNWEQRCSSACDSWSFCACSTSDASSFLSTCSCCQNTKKVTDSSSQYNNNYGDEETGSFIGNHGRSTLEYPKTYEPVTADRITWSNQIKQLKQKLRSSKLSRTSSESWNSWSMYANFESIPLAIASKEKRMKELTCKLKQFATENDDDETDDWNPSPESVRLGLIYVPMHSGENEKVLKKPPPVPPKKPKMELLKLIQEMAQALEDKEEERDPLGSLESLIFEPKESVDLVALRSINESKCDLDDQPFYRTSDETDLETIRTSGFESKPSSKDTVGNYWDWGKMKASRSLFGSDDNLLDRSSSLSSSSSSSTTSSDDSKSTIVKKETESDDTEVMPRSSSLSECKTLAGTSVASWTYIGAVHRYSKSESVDLLNDKKPELVTSNIVPIIPKKAVTWKLINDQNGQQHECGPLDLNPPEGYTSWSDLESLIFATDESGSSVITSIKRVITQQINNNNNNNNINNVNNRMSCYRDDWMYWDQQRKLRRTSVLDSDQQTWRNKAKRMLLWMHYSQGHGQGQVPVEQWSWWKAKLRSSILWLICKANGNKVPDNLRDPYYKDHDDRDQLKPLIVHALASAEYYCLALGNIYADQNYHHLNHWGVIQALSRKGVYVAEPSDVSLTETVLIQTSPIRMSAHMAVIEAMMALYLKETVTVERIVHAVKRFVPLGGPIELPTDIEEALVFWINKVCVKMKHRIEDEMNIATPDVQKAKGAVISKGVDISRQAVKSKVIGVIDKYADESFNVNERVAPPIPLLQDLNDLSDGCSLATVISYYCPSLLRWQDICLNDPMSMADSLYNIQLMQKFCRNHLPFDPCFLTLEDLVYQHSSIRQNILVFLAELFYMFEVRPSSCVKGFASRPEVVSPEAAGLVRRNGHSGLVSGATKRSFHNPVSPIPDLRSNSYSNIVADQNRLSSKNSSSVHREPLLPRRQSSQHERMQDRTKRFSFTDGPKGCHISTNSMRRTHSMQDIDKNGDGGPAISAHGHSVESNYGHLTAQQQHQSHDARRNAFGKESDDDGFYNDANELYTRSSTGGRDVEPLMPAVVKPAKEKSNHDSKPEEMGESVRHGQQPHQLQQPSFGRSRGFTPIKQLGSPLATIESSITKHENFPDVISGYNLKNEKFSSCDFPDNRDVEEHIRTNESTGIPYSKQQPFLLMTDDGVRLKEGLESLGSSESGIFMDKRDPFPIKSTATTSFAQLSKLRDHNSQSGGGGINIVYMQHDSDSGSERHPLKSSFLQRGKGDKSDRKASFANLPNQTTWQQQGGWRQLNEPSSDAHHDANVDVPAPSAPLATQLCDVRLKLEEKRRRIESEKKKMEMMMGQVRQKVGKAAFLQAVSKGKSTSGNNGSGSESVNVVGSAREMNTNGDNPANYDEYGRSIDQLNSNLSDLQTDLQQLSLKQEEIQSLMHNGVQQQQLLDSELGKQFYLHDDGLSNASGNFISRPLQRSQSREQLYQPPMQRGQSRELLYQPLQRSLSREQLCQPTLQRSLSREQLNYQPMQRSTSREQLYQVPLHRSPSFEVINYQQQQPMIHVASTSQWGPQVAVDMQTPPRPVSVGPILTQHQYVDQSGYIIHTQPAPPPPPSGYSIAPQYIPVTNVGYQNGPPVDYYGQYAQPHASADGYGLQQSPFRLHMDMGMSPQQHIEQIHRPPSRSQSPMTYNQVTQPPSRPHSVTSFPNLGHGPSLPAKATPVKAPPEFVMEPQSVHFIEGTQDFEDADVEQKPAYSSLEHLVSGTATYRVREPASPTRPLLGKTFRVPKPKVLSPTGHHPNNQAGELMNESIDDEIQDNDKGFFVSFDSEQPKKPKPPLRTKKVPKIVSKSEAVTSDKEKPSESFERLSQCISPDRSRISVSNTRTFDQGVFTKTPPERDRGSAESDASCALEDMAVVAKAEASAVGLIIGSELVNLDPVNEDEMARRKEKILMSVIKRKEEQETLRAKKEMEAAKRREHERMKQEVIDRKKDEERARRQAILDQYKQRKASLDDQDGGERYELPRNTNAAKNKNKFMKPRPKSLHESALSAAENRAAVRMASSSGGSGGGSQLNLTGNGNEASGYSNAYGRYTEMDSRMGRSTPPRGAESPGHMHPLSPTMNVYTSPPGVGLPPGLVSRRIGVGPGVMFSDTASDSCSTASSTVEYTGPKLFKQPTAKSNRGIIINAINAVLAGAVNADTKKRVLEEIAQSDSKHFLILFRDAGCQFRALYSYAPEKDEVFRLMGVGPKQVNEKMMDKFFKYNCGGRSFTDIQTKHLTVTIDAFTIHNSLWQTKRPVMQKKEYL